VHSDRQAANAGMQSVRTTTIPVRFPKLIWSHRIHALAGSALLLRRPPLIPSSQSRVHFLSRAAKLKLPSPKQSTAELYQCT
jgi:hypothetical protein